MRLRSLLSSSFSWALLFFIAAQLLIEHWTPDLAYLYRMDYSVIKDNLACVGATLDALKAYIDRNGLTDYVVLIGDSVMYSGPGGPLQSVSYFMTELARENGWLPVFNLAIPAAQMGDFYTILLMMDARGISTDRLVLNVGYASFIARDPDPPIVYWLERDLRELDPDAYRKVEDALKRSRENKNRPGKFESFLEYEVYSKIPVLKYRDFIRAAVERKLGIRSYETGDPRPWTEKPYLKALLKDPVYQRQFDPAPLVLDDSNSAVWFFKKIAEHQRHKGLLVFLEPVNKALMREETSAPGFLTNMENLNAFMEQTAREYGFTYADLTDALPYQLFSDHLHLTREGYKLLAERLWTLLNESVITSAGLSHGHGRGG